jgi:hypothetical protein
MTSRRYRVRTATEIVDAGFALIRPHYSTLVTLSLLSVAIASPVYLGHVAAGPDRLPFGIPNWLGILYVFLTGAWVYSAILAAAADIYHGRKPDTPAALRRVVRRPFAILLTSIYVWGLVFVGLILLIAPGLFVLARYGLAPVGIVLEQNGIMATLRRSATLTQGSRKKVLAVYALAYLPLLVLNWVIAGAFIATGNLGGSSELVTGVFGAAVTPIVAGITVALFYDLRIAREGYDLELLAAQLDDTDPAGTPSL